MSVIENVTNTNASDVISTSVDPTLIFGPQRDSLYIVLPITIIYTLIFITGLCGNIFTCIVIVRNKSMHTATNYYLFSLAISDLLLLVSGMPQEIYSIWSKWPYVFGHSFCLIRGLAAETSTNASVLTITLFTVERYLAICHPFVSHKMSKLSRAAKHVVLLWVAALMLALPQALQFGIKEHRGVEMCLQTRVIIQHSFEISTFFFFFAPMIMITVLYSLIGWRLKKTNNSKESQEHKNFERSIRFTHKLRRRHSKSTTRVVKMLVAVVMAFFICWAPFHAQRLVAIYGTAENHLARSPLLLFVYSAMTYTSGVFYYMSTCINPILYHIMSNKFRDAFKNTMLRCCRMGERPVNAQRCSYTAMPFARHPTSSATENSGNSLKHEMCNSHTKATRQDSRGIGNNSNVTPLWQMCDYCRPTSAAPSQDCRLLNCAQNLLTSQLQKNQALNDEPQSNRNQKRLELNKTRLSETSTYSDNNKHCYTRSYQESPNDRLVATPNLLNIATKPEYPSDEPEKYTTGIKMGIMQREKEYSYG